MTNNINNTNQGKPSSLEMHSDIENSYLNYKNTNISSLINKKPSDNLDKQSNSNGTKNYFSSFISSALTITSAMAFTHLVLINSIHILGATKDFHATVESNFQEKDIVYSSFNDNKEKLKALNDVALLQTKNFLKDDDGSILDKISLKLKEDITYYRGLGMHPIDTYNSIVMTPRLTETGNYILDEIDIMKYSNTYIQKLGQYFKIFSYEQETNSYSNSTKNHYTRNIIDRKTLGQQLDSKNCSITLKTDKNGYMLKIQSSAGVEGIEKEIDKSLLSIDVTYNDLEKSLLQEFVFLHEYAHCLVFAGLFDPDFSSKYLGASDNESVAAHSKYLSAVPSLLVNSDKFNYLNNNEPSYLENRTQLMKQSEETLADAFSITMLLHRYMNTSEESLISLNKVISHVYLLRLQSQLLSPFGTHNGYEVVKYLSHPDTLIQIKELNSFDDILAFSMKAFDHSKNWRLFHNKGFVNSNMDLQSILIDFEKIMFTNLLTNSSDKNKFNNAYYFKTNQPSVFKELIEISSDYMFTYYNNHKADILSELTGKSLSENEDGFFFTKFYLDNYKKYFDHKGSSSLNEKLKSFEKSLSTTELDPLAVSTLLALAKLNHNLNLKSREVEYEVALKYDEFEEASKYMGYFYNSTYLIYTLKDEHMLNTLFPETKPVYYENFLASVASFVNQEPLKVAKKPSKEDIVILKNLFGTDVFEDEMLSVPFIPLINIDLDKNIKIANLETKQNKALHSKK